MAIYPKASAPDTSPPYAINIEAWTEEATQSLSAVSLSPGSVPGTGVSIAIDLDDRRADDTSSGYRPRREPLRRDSLKRREALLKGKEGSRRRVRWENGIILGHHDMDLINDDLGLMHRSSIEQSMGATPLTE